LLVSRAALKEKVIYGPILIDDGFATVFIPVGWSTRLDPSGNILIQKEV